MHRQWAPGGKQMKVKGSRAEVQDQLQRSNSYPRDMSCNCSTWPVYHQACFEVVKPDFYLTGMDQACGLTLSLSTFHTPRDHRHQQYHHQQHLFLLPNIYEATIKPQGHGHTFSAR